MTKNIIKGNGLLNKEMKMPKYIKRRMESNYHSLRKLDKKKSVLANRYPRNKVVEKIKGRIIGVYDHVIVVDGEHYKQVINKSSLLSGDVRIISCS